MLSRRLLRIKAVQSMYAALERGDNSGKTSTAVKELTDSADSCYQLYLVFLKLIVKLKDFADERIKIGKAKFQPTEAELNPNMRFVENPVIRSIEEAISLVDIDLLVDWGQHKEIIADLYKNLIASDYYSLYMNLENCNLAQHKRVIKEFLEKTLVENVHIENLIEEKSIFWIDDIEYAASFIYEGISQLKKDSPFTISEKYVDKDVENFGKDLIKYSLNQSEENFGMVAGNTKNWEPDRIAIMDKVILLVAIAEIRNFPSIPIKVSIDEYVDISKFYSSEDSSTFINGVLDKVVQDMQTDGLIQKSGRGLLQ